MGRILGSHFNRDGKPKRGYSSEHIAKAEAARFGKSYYRCDVCEEFHLATDRGEPAGGGGAGRTQGRRRRRRTR